MKAGLEVHQQLATGKLFCACPPELTETVSSTFLRRLRASSGESQRVDAATAFQASRGHRFRYESGPSNCLVEMDEEPPHALNEEALDTALTLALLLDARPADEVQVMRKIVVDGSNTTGFQRTALIATGGELTVRGRRHEILSICLEEDAARRMGGDGSEVTYRLDRLGIGLIEIATAPDIESGTEAREVAEELGELLRATRRVRRGIGTIREDLNVSAEGGHRIEVKGVQELGMIHEYVDREVARQNVLLRVREELVRRNAPAPGGGIEDVSEWAGAIPSGPLSDVRRSGRRAFALALPGFAGLLRSPEGSDERLGRELADQARTVGLRGLLHSDELPGSGVDASQFEAIRRRLSLGPMDAFVVVVAPDESVARQALQRVAVRATEARDGIPGETRDPLPDGRTRYSRPLPGRDRMYPETDVPPIPILPDRLARLAAHLPERPGERRARLIREFALGEELARQLLATGEADRFERLCGRGHDPRLVARLLTQELPEHRAPPGASVVELGEDALDAALGALARGEFSKEGLGEVLASLAAGASNVPEAVARAGLRRAEGDDLEAVVDRVVRSNAALLRERGEAAFSPLMGDVMKEVRGRVDGRRVAEALRRAIAQHRADGGASR